MLYIVAIPQKKSFVDFLKLTARFPEINIVEERPHTGTITVEMPSELIATVQEGGFICKAIGTMRAS